MSETASSPPLPNVEAFAAAVEAAPTIIPPLGDEPYETLPVDRIDRFIETRKERAKESSDPAELRRLNDELDTLFNARAVAAARESSCRWSPRMTSP
jgi:hypothetical protein